MMLPELFCFTSKASKASTGSNLHLELVGALAEMLLDDAS
jgi:hypothetical protein